MITFFLLGIISLVFSTGFEKIDSDISRIIKNSSPKNGGDVYSLLFKKPIDNCATIIHFKDQFIPKIDCCIWMELKLCPAELTRLTTLKNYQASFYIQSDSMELLKSFSDKPDWWTPQNLGDTVHKLSFQFNNGNQQTLLFGNDSSHVYLCDSAP